jgi:hypothetical protein
MNPLLPRLFTMTKLLIVGLTTTFALSGCQSPTNTVLPTLSDHESAWIGRQIFRNECNLKIECLTSWNIGETFPSLGIGHFIWFRAGQKETFVESFPQLLQFYRDQEQAIPEWITSLKGSNSPWNSREQFLQDIDSARMGELRDFLLNTQSTQVQFIVNRMQKSLPQLINNASHPDAIAALFIELASSQRPAGLYALIDYINFKGEGVAPQERYQDQGWGLLQVLEHLHENRHEGEIVAQFAASASQILARRVQNAPTGRNEQQWLNGWNNRLATYTVTADL